MGILQIKKLFIVVLILLCAGMSQAEDLYVCHSSGEYGTEDGSSWANCFDGFSDISWGAGAGSVSAGDTLYIDGGSSGVTYTATGNNMLTVGASGSEGSPITIATGAKSPSPSGHDGMVTFDGNGSYNTLVSMARDYVTLDGEKSGAINWRLTNCSMGDYNPAISIGGNDYQKVLYVQIDIVNTGISGAYTDYVEIAYNNIFDIRGQAAVFAICSNTGGGGCGGTVAGYGLGSIHHNTIRVNTAAPSGYGPDGLQNGGGFDIYNNNFSSINGSIVGAQHPDYLQNAGPYLRIYNNEFRNPIDSAIDFDVSGNMNGKLDYTLIYNNVFVCDSTISSQASWPSGVRVYNQTDSTITYFVFANNTFVDWGSSGAKNGYPFRFQTGGSASASNSLIQNNIFYNSGNGSYDAFIITASSGATQADWNFDYNLINAGDNGDATVTIDGSSYTQSNPRTTAPTFTTYSAGSAANVYTLSSADTGAKDLGDSTGLTGYFTTDKDGTTRSGTWDIGAYEYSEETPTNTIQGITIGYRHEDHRLEMLKSRQV